MRKEAKLLHGASQFSSSVLSIGMVLVCQVPFAARVTAIMWRIASGRYTKSISLDLRKAGKLSQKWPLVLPFFTSTVS